LPPHPPPQPQLEQLAQPLPHPWPQLPLHLVLATELPYSANSFMSAIL
jgi:hypothetical protein